MNLEIYLSLALIYLLQLEKKNFDNSKKKKTKKK